MTKHYEYDPFEKEIVYAHPVSGQTINRGENNLSLLRISENRTGLFGEVKPFSLSLYNASLNVLDGSRGQISLRSSNELRDRLGYRFTLFYVDLYDVTVQSISGPHFRYSAWVVEPFRFYPADWAGKPELVNDGEEHTPPSVLAPNLPSPERPMRVEISVFFKSEEWIVDGL